MPRKPKRHPETPETTLYAPVKRYLEVLGFTVKECGIANPTAMLMDKPSAAARILAGVPRSGLDQPTTTIGGSSPRSATRSQPQTSPAAALTAGELKLAFSLELVLQGVNGTAACDEVWLATAAFPRGSRPVSCPTIVVHLPPARPTVFCCAFETDRHAG